MSCFEPCPACKRHVTTDETVCPFCAAPLPECSQKVKRTPLKGRLSRAALLAVGAGAALIGSSCAGSAYGLPPRVDSGGSSMSDGSTDGDGSGGASGSGGAGGAVALYGAPAPAASEQPAAAPAAPADPTADPAADPKSAKT